MKKISLSILVIILLMGCSGITIDDKYSDYIGQWESKDSLLSISPKGKVHYFTKVKGKSAGMTGNAIIVNEEKIVFIIIIIPKTLKITDKIEIKNGSLTMEIDNVVFRKVSNEPYRSLAERWF